MSNEFAEIHDELRAVARDLLHKTSALNGDGREGGSPDWGVMVESGWLGLEVPEDLGGAGATFAETAVLLHEMGRAAATTSPFAASVLAVGALLATDEGDARDELLSELATGTSVVTVALPAGDTAEPTVRLDGTRLDGEVDFVLDAAECDRLLVVAASAAGPVLVLVAPGADGLHIEPRPVVDATRRLTKVTAAGVDVAAILPFTGDAAAALGALRDRAPLIVACDGLGLAEAMLDVTVEYAKVRKQFDRPIGSFQSVKHQCADMLVTISIARELLTAAIDATVTGAPDTGLRVAMAKSYLGTGAVEVAGRAMQLHGGIGYTWESGVHVYLKRAALDRSLFGSPAAHRTTVAARYREPATSA